MKKLLSIFPLREYVWSRDEYVNKCFSVVRIPKDKMMLLRGREVSFIIKIFPLVHMVDIKPSS